MFEPSRIKSPIPPAQRSEKSNLMMCSESVQRRAAAGQIRFISYPGLPELYSRAVCHDFRGALHDG
jgi:hypothetical protein